MPPKRKPKLPAPKSTARPNGGRRPKKASAAKTRPAKKRVAAKKPGPGKGRSLATKPARQKKLASAGAPKRNAQAKKRAAGATPWQRMRYDNGGWGLFFAIDTFDSLGVPRLFEEAGAYPNGYGWESVIAPAFEKMHPALAEKVEYDCEADTFVVRAEDEASLDAVAEVIAAVTANAEVLAAALKERDPERD
jgi:hypothetical protein